jgi:glycosyltransferase involved in cell wall biosynthesis
MDISVVIPTCNRKSRLLSLLDNLDRSSYALSEVIIVDSGNDKLTPADYIQYKNLNIHCVESDRSVCIQRNIGIKKAISPWIFLCDDDIEVPVDYLQKLIDHISVHNEAGSVSGLFLQMEKDQWTGQYALHSATLLLWKFIFQQSIWGAIDCKRNNFLIKKIKLYYKRKGNHISKAGWPVLTDFSGNYFVTPLYSLGASLVKREWLVNAPYDEVLDSHGIGDNYGVAADFPGGIHVLNNAFIYHHQEPANRLQRPLQYFRRVLALDYFIRTKKSLKHVKKRWLLWSLIGSFLSFTFAGDARMMKVSFKSIMRIVSGANPYCQAVKSGQKITEPVL